VAIVDVFLLAVLIPSVIVIWFLNRDNFKRRVLAWSSLFFVVAYFGLSIIIKENLESKVKDQLIAEGKTYLRIQTAPLPMSNLLWMVLVEDSMYYHVEQRNLLNVDKPILSNSLVKNHQLLNSANFYEIERIKDFTKGLYVVEKEDNGWFIYDLRYSSLAENYPEAYVFKFDVKKQGDTIIVGRSHPKRHININNIKYYINRLLAKN
jgi:inner membrane protein